MPALWNQLRNLMFRESPSQELVGGERHRHRPTDRFGDGDVSAKSARPSRPFAKPLYHLLVTIGRPLRRLAVLPLGIFGQCRRNGRRRVSVAQDQSNRNCSSVPVASIEFQKPGRRVFRRCRAGERSYLNKRRCYGSGGRVDRQWKHRQPTDLRYRHGNYLTVSPRLASPPAF